MEDAAPLVPKRVEIQKVGDLGLGGVDESKGRFVFWIARVKGCRCGTYECVACGLC